MIVTLPVEQSQSSTALLGGKAANLNRLLLAGYPVPSSVVIATEAYQAFIRANNLDGSIQSWTNSSISDGEILRQFVAAQMPGSMADSIRKAYRSLGSKPVAVRSSATTEDLREASFAGQQDSFLHVQGETAVLEAIKKCWASLWMGRAVAYRGEHTIKTHHVHMAVLLQPMVPADCAGVLFTQDPVSPNQETIIIEAVPGLADALVSGVATPDHYRVNRHSKDIEAAKTQGDISILTDNQVRQLADTGLAIADLFRMPQDIEWAIAGEQLYILQSRAVTTEAPQVASLPADEVHAPGDDQWLPEENMSHPFDLWTRANFGEVLPNPVTPLTLSSFQLMGDAAEVQLSSGEKIQMARRIYGRIYANEGGMRQFAADLGLPTSFINATWGSRRPDLLPKAGFRPWRLLVRLPQLLRQSMNSRSQSSPKEPQLPKDEAELFKQIDAWTAALQNSDLAAMSEAELWHAIRMVWEPRRIQVYQRHTTVSTGAFLSFAPLEWMAKKWANDARLAQTLITGLTGVYAAQMGPALQRIAQALREADLVQVVRENPPQAAWNKLQVLPQVAVVREALGQFMDEFGHRCPAEPEISLPRWVEAPEQIIALAAGYLSAAPAEQENPRQPSAQAARRAFEKQLDPFRRSLFRRVLLLAQNQVRRRDNSRHFMAKVELSRRLLFVELGKRWHERGILSAVEDIFFLTHGEIGLVIENGDATGLPRSIPALTAERRQAYDFWCSYPFPEAVDAGGNLLPNPQLSPAEGLQGVPASGGKATGPVRIIRSPLEAGRLQPGDILVTLATDPGWTPVFPLAAGLILVYGGQLSHGAIVAREYGVPAVVNVAEAMTRLQEGMVVTVDGSSGRVYW